jgi:hypothetical protein
MTSTRLRSASGLSAGRPVTPTSLGRREPGGCVTATLSFRRGRRRGRLGLTGMISSSGRRTFPSPTTVSVVDKIGGMRRKRVGAAMTADADTREAYWRSQRMHCWCSSLSRPLFHWQIRIPTRRHVVNGGIRTASVARLSDRILSDYAEPHRFTSAVPISG